MILKNDYLCFNKDSGIMSLFKYKAHFSVIMSTQKDYVAYNL